MAKKSADNLLASIERARTGRSFDRLLARARDPTRRARSWRASWQKSTATWQTCWRGTPAALQQDLAEIAGVGPKIADSVAGFLASPEQREMLQKLLESGGRGRDRAA